jgi:hypothetical protein
MDRLTHSTGRPKHLERNLNRLDVVAGNNKPTSTAQNQTALPTLRNTIKNNGIKLYPFIQQNEYKYRDLQNSSETDSSSIVESSSYSDEDDIDSFKKSAFEPTFNSRPTLSKEKNSTNSSEVHAISFFEHMPEDVIKKILFEQLIDLNNIPATAKNLMVFAGVSKFNREFVRNLLAEEGMHEVSFEISKSVIPDLLATLANDKKAKFTETDIDRLVHDWPYLTFDCSYEVNKENFTNQGLQVLKKIVRHPSLKEIRIISNLPEKISEGNENFIGSNNKGLELIYSLLSRKGARPLKVDLTFNNCQLPLDSEFKINENSFELIKKIQNRADKCESAIFGRVDLSRSKNINLNFFGSNPIHNGEYQFQYLKMMCNITLTHSAHTISLASLKLSDSELGLILDEIQLCDKSSLKNLDLSRNDIKECAANSLSMLLQLEKTNLKTLILNCIYISDEAFDILAVALKNNHSLELIVIKNVLARRFDHPIINDKRVRLT